jgi:hypothetical protein
MGAKAEERLEEEEREERLLIVSYVSKYKKDLEG